MKSGEYIIAKTHADLLNKVLGTHYKAWMKSGITLSDGRWLWMIRLNRSVNSSGWMNYMESEDRLVEKAISPKYEDHHTYIQAVMSARVGRFEDRAVFDIVDYGTYRKYIFRGVFKLNKAECTENINIWDKIISDYRF